MKTPFSGYGKYSKLVVIILMVLGCKEKNTTNDAHKSPIAVAPIDTNNLSTDETPKDTLSYRDQNWHPEKGEYYFSETYHFSYYNESLKEDVDGGKGEFGFYVDPESGTLLLEKYITNYSDEMTNYVIVEPNGTYILGYTDEFGNQKTIKKTLSEIAGFPEKMAYGADDFKMFFKKLDKMETFGANKYYPTQLRAQSYQRTFPKLQDTVALFLAKSDLPTRALYMVGEMFPELGMPIRQDYGFMLPERTLVVQEHYETPSGEGIGFRLTSIMASEYYIKLPDLEP